MNKRNYIMIALALALLTAISGCYPANNGKVPLATISVARAELSSGNETPMFSGKLEAQNIANVVSKTTGRVGSVNVDIGSRVKAGDVLLTLDANELAAAVSQAEAAVGVARYNRDTAQIDYQTALDNYRRNKSLYEQGAISESVFENSYEQPLKKAEQWAKFGSEAALQQAQAALEVARANYAYTVISSPIDGIVTAKNINPGELASASLTLFNVVNLNKVFMQTAVDENYINRLKEGSSIPVKVPSASDQIYSGVITNIAEAASTSSKGYTVKILINNPQHILKPGMFAEAFPSNIEHSNITIPKTAVINEGGQNYAWLVENGRVYKKKVEKGNSDAVRTSIKAGLKAGQQVATSGLAQLKEGMPVSIATD